jgi:hypothetical protein
MLGDYQVAIELVAVQVALSSIKLVSLHSFNSKAKETMTGV